MLDFPNDETTTLGTEEGNVYQAQRYDRARATAGLDQYDVYKGHNGIVMGLHLPLLVGLANFSDLLTCSVDWTVELWRAKSLTGMTGPPPSSLSTNLASSTSGKTAGTAGLTHLPLRRFTCSKRRTIMFRCRVAPLHPAVFDTADGSGKFNLWT